MLQSLFQLVLRQDNVVLQSPEDCHIVPLLAVIPKLSILKHYFSKLVHSIQYLALGVSHKAIEDVVESLGPSTISFPAIQCLMYETLVCPLLQAPEFDTDPLVSIERVEALAKVATTLHYQSICHTQLIRVDAAPGAPPPLHFRLS